MIQNRDSKSFEGRRPVSKFMKKHVAYLVRLKTY